MHLSAKHPRARAQRMISYVLIFIFVATGTYILTRYTQGFEIDPTTRSLVQNGLVLIESEPVDSTVFIDNKDTGEQTPSRITLPVGDHAVRLQAEGYHSWNKNFQIIGSDLVWMNYPLLIPEKIETENIAVFAKQPVVALSRNRRILASGQPDTKTISIFNVNSDTVSETDLTLPEAVLTELSTSTLTKLTFAADDQFLLAQFTADGSENFVLINREDIAASTIMDTTYSIDFDEIQFDSGDADQMYALAGQSLHRIQRTNPAASELVADNIQAFRSDADTLSVVQRIAPAENTASKFGILDNNDAITFLSGELPEGPYTIANGSYEGDETIAISTATSTSVFPDVGSDKSIRSKQIKIGTAALTFSGDGRFLLVQKGATCEIVDFEFNKRYNFILPDEPESESRWIDDSHISVIVAGVAKIIEFDGDNSQDIMAANGTAAPFTNANSEAFFSIGLAKDRYVLHRSSLVVEN